MRKPIDGTRLKKLREQKKLSQKELAGKAGINEHSLSRIERGIQSGKTRVTGERLSHALGVSIEVLTGEAPMPDRARSEPASDRHQLNVRVGGAARNAFNLAAMRYRIPVSQIIELAPFLFVVAAEQSLRRRSAHVAELEETLDKAWKLGEASGSYLLRNAVVSTGHPPELDAERASIASRDILAGHLDQLSRAHSIFPYDIVEESYNDASDNPFVQSLRESADGLGVAEIEAFTVAHTDYRICWDEAVAFAGGDEAAAEMIVNGRILMRDIPREFPGSDAMEGRKVWLQDKVAEIRASEMSFSGLAEVLDP